MNDFQVTSFLDKKLAKYGLLGAAVMGLSTVAKAETLVIHSGVNTTVGVGGTYTFDLGANTGDITLGVTTSLSTDDGDDVTATVSNGAQLVGQPFPAALAFGDVVSPSTSLFDTSGGLANSKYDLGNFLDGKPHYLGFEFQGTDGYQAGWALVSADVVDDPGNPSAKVYSYAYDTVANEDIHAGDGVAPVPEPSSLSLLALGAAGLAAYRRRNAAAA